MDMINFENKQARTEKSITAQIIEAKIWLTEKLHNLGVNEKAIEAKRDLLEQTYHMAQSGIDKNSPMEIARAFLKSFERKN